MGTALDGSNVDVYVMQSLAGPAGLQVPKAKLPMGCVTTVQCWLALSTMSVSSPSRLTPQACEGVAGAEEEDEAKEEMEDEEEATEEEDEGGAEMDDEDEAGDGAEAETEEGEDADEEIEDDWIDDELGMALETEEGRTLGDEGAEEKTDDDGIELDADDEAEADEETDEDGRDGRQREASAKPTAQTRASEPQTFIVLLAWKGSHKRRMTKTRDAQTEERGQEREERKNIVLPRKRVRPLG